MITVLSPSPFVCLFQNRHLFGGKFGFSFSAINMARELCNTGVSIRRTLDLIPLPFEPGKLCFHPMVCLEFANFNGKHRQTKLQSTAWLKTHRLSPRSEGLLWSFPWSRCDKRGWLTVACHHLQGLRRPKRAIKVGSRQTTTRFQLQLVAYVQFLAMTFQIIPPSSTVMVFQLGTRG